MNKAEKFWDKQAKRFDSSQQQFDAASQEIISRTKRYLNPGDNVLDFGCATGLKTIELASLVNHIHGLDSSFEMINEATKKKENSKVKNVTFSHGTIFTGDLEIASFDSIIAYSIVHLLEDEEKVVQRIHQLLKPGGLFISETACFKDNMSFKTRLEFTTIRWLKHLGAFPLHLNMYNVSKVEQLIKNNNFEILEAEKFFFNGMTIIFIVGKKR